MANKTDKILKFKEAYENIDVFTKEIVAPIQAMYPNAKWLNPAFMQTPFNTLYKLFIAKHGEKYLRYDFAQVNGIFQLELIDKLPDLYAKQSIISDESLDKLTNFAERGFTTVIEGNVGGTDTPNNSGADIDIKAGENVTRKQKSKQTSKAFNFVSDLTKLLDTKISTYMIDFLDMFNKALFVNAQIQAKLDTHQSELLFKSFFGQLQESLKAGAGISFVIDQNGETIEIQNSIHPHITNGNTDPETETIKLEDDDLGGTYNLKVMLEDLKAVRDQADAIGNHEFKDENGVLISFDENNPKQVYTVEAIDAIVKRTIEHIEDSQAIKDLTHLTTQGEIFDNVDPLKHTLYLIKFNNEKLLFRLKAKYNTIVELHGQSGVGAVVDQLSKIVCIKDSKDIFDVILLQISVQTPTLLFSATNKKYVDDKFKPLKVTTGDLSRANGQITNAYKRGDVVTYVSDSITGVLAYDDTNIKYNVSGIDIVDEALNANTYIVIGQLYL